MAADWRERVNRPGSAGADRGASARAGAGNSDAAEAGASSRDLLLDRARRELGREPGGYLTLAVVRVGRSERQVARLPGDQVARVRSWLDRAVGEAGVAGGSVKLRLRLYGPGGAALGSAAFVVAGNLRATGSEPHIGRESSVPCFAPRPDVPDLTPTSSPARTESRHRQSGMTAAHAAAPWTPGQSSPHRPPSQPARVVAGTARSDPPTPHAPITRPAQEMRPVGGRTVPGSAIPAAPQPVRVASGPVVRPQAEAGLHANPSRKEPRTMYSHDDPIAHAPAPAPCRHCALLSDRLHASKDQVRQITAELDRARSDAARWERKYATLADSYRRLRAEHDELVRETTEAAQTLSSVVGADRDEESEQDLMEGWDEEE